MGLGGAQRIVLALRVLLSCAGLLGHDLEPALDRREVGKHKVERELLQLGGGIRVRAEAAGDLDQHVGLACKRDALRTAARRGVFDRTLRPGSYRVAVRGGTRFEAQVSRPVSLRSA